MIFAVPITPFVDRRLRRFDVERIKDRSEKFQKSIWKELKLKPHPLPLSQSPIHNCHNVFFFPSFLPFFLPPFFIPFYLFIYLTLSFIFFPFFLPLPFIMKTCLRVDPFQLRRVAGLTWFEVLRPLFRWNIWRFYCLIYSELIHSIVCVCVLSKNCFVIGRHFVGGSSWTGYLRTRLSQLSPVSLTRPTPPYTPT